MSAAALPKVQVRPYAGPSRIGQPQAVGQKWIVGIGELKASARADDTIVTHALGSCVAVCVWDPVTKAGGLLHYLLPEAKINPERAASNPAAFADTGIPKLMEAAAAVGVDKKRARVKLVGGAEIVSIGNGALNIGRRNALAAKQILWRAGILVAGELLGGTDARTVMMRLSDGVLIVRVAGADREL